MVVESTEEDDELSDDCVELLLFFCTERVTVQDGKNQSESERKITTRA